MSTLACHSVAMKTIEERGTTRAAGAEIGGAEHGFEGHEGIRPGQGDGERRDCGDRGEGQLELGLRSVAAPRPRRVVRGRRYVAARWWFAQMREAVRTTPEWAGARMGTADGEQALLSLTQSPTRFERRSRAA